MRTLTLLIRAYAGSQLRLVSELLKTDLEGLKVDLQVRGLSYPGWVQVAVSGEDETMALNYLTREFGQCPEQLEHVERFSTVAGRMMALRGVEDEVAVDIGVLAPRVGATVSLSRLQAQLADGRKVGLRRMVELFGFCEGLPFTVKVLSVSVEEKRVEAMLAERQVSLYKNWTGSLLDRLIIIGAAVGEVRSALRRAGCNRDVAGVEPLGLLESAVVCKLGTDAVGLIPKVGRQLSRGGFSVFSPRRVLGFFEGDASFLVS